MTHLSKKFILCVKAVKRIFVVETRSSDIGELPYWIQYKRFVLEPLALLKSVLLSGKEEMHVHRAIAQSMVVFVLTNILFFSCKNLKLRTF